MEQYKGSRKSSRNITGKISLTEDKQKESRNKEVNSSTVNSKKESKSLITSKKVSNNSDIKPDAVLKAKTNVKSNNDKDKSLKSKQDLSNGKVNKGICKSEKSLNVNLNTIKPKRITSSVQKDKSIDKDIKKKTIKKEKKMTLNNLDDISFEDIEKRIFEDISNKSKKASFANENLNNSSSGESSDNKKALKKMSSQSKASSSSKKQSEKLSQIKELEKRSSQNKDRKMISQGKGSEKISKSRSTSVDNHHKTGSSRKDRSFNKSKSSSKTNSTKKVNCKKELLESSSDEGEWEDVDELSQILQNKDSKAVKDVQIELETGDILWGIKKRKRRTHQEQIEDYVRKEINRTVRGVHENMHKIHLLCLLSHGMYVNSLLCSPTLASCALSVIPPLYYSPKRLDISHLEKFVNWFYSHFKIKSNNDKELKKNSDSLIEDALIMRFETKSPTNVKEMVLMFVATCRTIGMTVRYVQNLTPITWKPSSTALLKPKKSDENDDKSLSVHENKPQNKTEKDPKKKSRKMLSSDSEVEVSNKTAKPKGKIKKISSSDEEDYDSDDDDDDDFSTPVKFNKKRASTSKGKSITTKRRKSDEMKEDGKKKAQKDVFQDWVEVYVEEEEKWIPVDVSRNKIHCSAEIEARSVNLAYVVAFNPDQTIKDVTKRYLSSWLSYKDKVRCDGDWWDETLKPFTKAFDRRERKEDKEMEANLKMQPLPKTISEYKNHPLYALQRHLLKFEAIYPPDASPVGFIRGEPVFPRECVYNLFGRDGWLKEAKTVIVDEEPYKIVKARPKWDRNSGQMIKDKPLEIFGEWQVEDYDPPTAKNGRVPRNEYGNVDFFKPSMLPKGCVHLRFNGLNRVARKLNVDCVPAVTGFDFHSGSCHAVCDGFIVCQEHKDFLVDAWNQDQMEQVKKEEEKRIKRIYDNWKKLINGITLKDRLKEKYGVCEESSNQDDASSSNVKEPKRKITQKDVDALPSSTITHSVVNLKIDYGLSVTDRMAKKVKRPKKSFSDKVKAKSKKSPKDVEKPNDNLSLLSSDSEISDGEKRKKIRSILDWKPTVNEADPGLSDDSDTETVNTHLKNSSLMLTPISENSSAGSKVINISSRSSNKIPKSKRKIDTIDRFSSCSDSEEEKKAAVDVSRKRRSLRTKTVKHINYKDGEESPSDISVEDSDTGDASYCPVED